MTISSQVKQSSSMSIIPDAKTSPEKTRDRIGIMVVGIGGANGTSMAAGIIGNRLKMEWRGPVGEEKKYNWQGCITQLKSKGKFGGVGYKDVLPLSCAETAAIGGWDIRPTKLGNALLKHQILDYDLVRRCQAHLNAIPVMKGVFDKDFIGSNQWDTAVNVVVDEKPRESLGRIRKDIRDFKTANKVGGHTTVIWSGSVEPNSPLVARIDSVESLLRVFETDEDNLRGGKIPPSLIYATAAVLEGCSFVNGGSQNTVCEGLVDLGGNCGVYVLGTDFKAGQTKFKTAAIEYIRTCGMTPLVCASSNHLGNNDMLNLSSPSNPAMSAKLNVKHDVFGPWEEGELDHKVCVMYTERINDDKRDYVEYTSAGFMGHTHTMVTYTRASDSCLCVPLMIDAAVWCDFFVRRDWETGRTAKALAYLFKVPSGSAVNTDPGFFHQMRTLKEEAYSAAGIQIPTGTGGVIVGGSGSGSMGGGVKEGRNSIGRTEGIVERQRVRIKENILAKGNSLDIRFVVPSFTSSVICVGLACVDMQLSECTNDPTSLEAINKFNGCKFAAGGSVSWTTRTLARMTYGEEVKGMFVPPPVFGNVVPICATGDDDMGQKLVNLLDSSSLSRNVKTSCISIAKGKATSTAVLPVYKDGKRGCFFDAGVNERLTGEELAFKVGECRGIGVGAVIFGYPHLLPGVQKNGGISLILRKAREVMEKGGIVVMDLNGIGSGEGEGVDVIEDCIADKLVDIIHVNEEELRLLSKGSKNDDISDEDYGLSQALSDARAFAKKYGTAVLTVTRGAKEAIIVCGNEDRFSLNPCLPSCWRGMEGIGKVAETGGEINGNGGGDSWTAGFLTAALMRKAASEKRSSKKGKKKKKKKKKKTRGPPANAFTLFAKGFFEDLVAKAVAAGLNPKDNDVRQDLVLQCDRAWAALSKDQKRKFVLDAAEINRLEDEEMLEEAFAGVREDQGNGEVRDEEGGGAGIEWERLSGNEENKEDGDNEEEMCMTLNEAIGFAETIAMRHVNVLHRDAPRLDVVGILGKVKMTKEERVGLGGISGGESFGSVGAVASLSESISSSRSESRSGSGSSDSGQGESFDEV